MAYTTIDNPELYFQTKLYTGNASTNAITLDGSENMQPDFVWCKNRASAKYHGLYDSVRGTGTSKSLTSNSTEAEGANANFINLTSFDSDGFTLGATSSTNQINTSGENHVAWNWKAGGTASSNSNGSITSSVSAGSTQGFSIVSYTGTGSIATVGHGLGVAPTVLIVKKRSQSAHWGIGSKHIDNWTDYLVFGTFAQQDDANFWNDTAPTSTVFSIGSSGNVNTSSETHIAYCFAPIKGFSKFGSYTGNGNADGSYIHLGFRPAFVLIKVTSTTNDWEIHDNKRGSSNVINAILQPNLTDAESTSGREIDFLSNGFKLRNSNSQNNLSGGTFIYMAFAESPFVNSNGVPNNAK